MCIITICKIFRCWHLEPIFRVDRCPKAIFSHVHYCNRECTPPVLIGKFTLAHCAVCAYQNSIPTHVSELEASPPNSISNPRSNSTSSSNSHRDSSVNLVYTSDVFSSDALQYLTDPDITTPDPFLDATSHGPLDEPYLSLFRALPHFTRSFSTHPNHHPHPNIYTPPPTNTPPRPFTHLISPAWLEAISSALEQTQHLAAELLWAWFPLQGGMYARRAKIEYERFVEDTRVDMEVLDLQACATELYSRARWGTGEICLCELEIDASDDDDGDAESAVAAAMDRPRFNLPDYNPPPRTWTRMGTGLPHSLSRPVSPLTRPAPGQVWVQPGLRELGSEAHRHHARMYTNASYGQDEVDEEEEEGGLVREEDAMMREG